MTIGSDIFQCAVERAARDGSGKARHALPRITVQTDQQFGRGLCHTAMETAHRLDTRVVGVFVTAACRLPRSHAAQVVLATGRRGRRTSSS